MKVMGLDLSLTGTGVAVVSSSSNIWHTTISSNPSLSRIEKCIDIANKIKSYVLDGGGCDEVFIEDYAYGITRANSLAYLGELNGIVKASILSTLGKPAYTVPIGVWKKFLCDNGALNKDEFKLRVYKKFGVECATNDSAAAIAIADFGFSIFTGSGFNGRKLNKYELNIIRKFSEKLKHE